MRNLQKFLFVSLLGVTLGTGCTITTSDGDDLGDMGGAGGTSTTAAGNTSVTGGTVGVGGTTTAPATGGSATGGASTTVPTYTAANCPALATISPPAYAADVTQACVSCIYSANKACTEAAACHNDAACVFQVYSALECIQIYYAWGGDSPLTLEERDACQNGDYANATPASGYETMTIKSSTPNEVWKGANVGPTGMTLMSAALTNCAAECSATLATTP